MFFIISAFTSSLLLTTVTSSQYMCTPNLWEGQRWTLHVSHTDQGPDVWESTSQFSVDVTGQRFASREKGVRQDRPYEVFYLYYYPANTLFKVENGNCETSTIEGGIKSQCISYPDPNRLETLNEFLPTYENGTYTAGVRGVKEGVGYFRSISTLSTSNIPVMEESQGIVGGVPTYSVSNFFNVTSGIRDPSVFTPPENCIRTQDDPAATNNRDAIPPSFFLPYKQ